MAIPCADGVEKGGTPYQTEWTPRLGSMFRKYPTGFDCDCMPEKGPVERLIVYLCKYVSSPPISLRRIVSYDGRMVRYRYEDHRQSADALRSVRVDRSDAFAHLGQAPGHRL